VPIFKCGSERSNDEARPRFQRACRARGRREAVARTWALPEERRIREAETRNDDDARMTGIPLSRQRARKGGGADDGERTLYLLLRGGDGDEDNWKVEVVVARSFSDLRKCSANFFVWAEK
jgi:hypothetical protein